MQRLHIDETILMVIDVQERLAPAIHDTDALVKSCSILARAAGLLQIPIIATEQYPEKLGATVPSIRDYWGGIEAFSKTQFSSCTSAVREALQQLSPRRSILLCGVEAHVCVLQTALDLCGEYDVFVARDAIGSRTLANRDMGWERMMRAGAIPVSVESALFELLQTSARPEFKAVHQLIK